MSTIIALVINLIILLFYEYDSVEQDDGSTIVKPVIEDWADKTIFVLGAI